MWIKTFYFLGLFFVALAWPCDGPSAGAAEQNQPFAEDYLTVQQIYRGWALLGIVVGGALISTLVLTVLLRRERRPFTFSLIGFLCIVGTQVVFWTYTYPANQATNNWTMLLDNGSYCVGNGNTPMLQVRG